MGALYDDAWVAAEVERCADLWGRCGMSPEPLQGLYSLRDHEARELAYDTALHEVEWEMKHVPRNVAHRAKTQDRVTESFARFAAQALDLDQSQVALLTEDFLPAGNDFARRARAFDPAISREDTIQACRNAWTACGLQPLLGVRCGITPAILAYSLLYPYSDNYLDHPHVPAEAKLSFSRRFRDRLQGHGAPMLNERERAVWALVDLIEAQFPRAQYPAVFACLLAIHRAQEESLAQCKGTMLLDDRRLLHLSLAKGGTSVLADACLVRGAMTSDESRVAFEWGALLQLGDDLQDIHSDRSSGSATLFTRALERGETLDRLVLQLLAFCQCASARMDALPCGSQDLKDLLRMSWRSLIIAAVGEAREFFSPIFVQQAEQCSPFRFGFLRRRRRKLAAREGLLAHVFDLYVEQEPVPLAPVFRRDPVGVAPLEAAL